MVDNCVVTKMKKPKEKRETLFRLLPEPIFYMISLRSAGSYLPGSRPVFDMETMPETETSSSEFRFPGTYQKG